MKKAALYVRVSTDDQKRNGMSIDVQIEKLIEYCKENRIKKYEIYNDAGKSARKRYTTRPELMRILEEVEQGQISCVLFTHADRWFRSMKDYYLVQDVLDRNKVPWVAICEKYDLSTPQGIFSANIMLSVSQQFADITSEKIRQTRYFCKMNGKYCGGVLPIGYKLEDKKVVIDEQTEEIVKYIFDRYLSTFSIALVLEGLHAMGITMSRERIRAMLRNESYTGNFVGVPVPTYISKETHEFILEKMSSRRKTSGNTKNIYLFSGLLVCPKCGKRMKGMNYKRVKVPDVKKYFCRTHIDNKDACDYLCVWEKDIEKSLLDLVMPEIEKHNVEIELKQSTVDVNEVNRKIDKKIERLEELYIDGDIEKDDYIARRKKLEDSYMAESKKPKKVELPETWREVYEDLDQVHRRAFWHSFIKKIYVRSSDDFDIEF